MVPDDVDDPAGRVERLVDRLAGGAGPALQLLLALARLATAGSTPADCLPLELQTVWRDPGETRYVCNCIYSVLFYISAHFLL